MKIYKFAYTDMDWGKYEQLKQALSELDINCEKWSTDQRSMVEVDVTSEDALQDLFKLKIINKFLYNELIANEVQILFLE